MKHLLSLCLYSILSEIARIFAMKDVFSILYGRRSSSVPAEHMMMKFILSLFFLIGLRVSECGLVARRLVARNDHWAVVADNNGEFFTFITFDRRNDIQRTS